MAHEVMKQLGTILETSDFLKTLGSLEKKRSKSRLFGNNVRPLTAAEIKKLKALGNQAEDWKKILVSKKFRPAHVENSRFRGACVLGAFDGGETGAGPSVRLPSGIYNSTIIGSEIGDNCCIWSAGCVSNYVVMEGSVVLATECLACSDSSSFGNGRELPIGIETGGREVLSFAEMTIPIAQAIAVNRSDAKLMGSYVDFVKKYAERCQIGAGVVEGGCVIRNTRKVEDSFIGAGTVIDGATLVRNSTVLSSPEEKVEIGDGAYVRNSCIQWGCHVISMSIVDDSVLTEHSHVERHGKVTQSIIGPNTGVAEGEVTASLVGPFVGFHHQAMLIAAVWPEGKGNVGYGANIGSNHTSKAPDQEIWCGEGTFFGLAVNIKFPCDFTAAPYSIIATGVTTLPQRVEYPFSLINSPTRSIAGVPPAYNELCPGWVLSDNIYMVKRNEGKYIKRNKAKRSAFVFDVFREDIIDMMVKARNRLKSVRAVKAHYTEEDLPGIGKNYMTEDARLKGIEAYNFYIEYYCLSGLKKHLEETSGKKGVDTGVYAVITKDPAWEHRRKLAIAEGFGRRGLSDNLKRLIELEEHIARETQKAKEKDDQRGKKIIPDYASAHAPAAKDSFVKETWARVETVKKEVDALLKRIG